MKEAKQKNVLVATAKLLLVFACKLVGIAFIFLARLVALALNTLSDFIEKHIKDGKDH